MALVLDKRRRAMLEEMGIKVWLPAQAASDGAPASPLAPTATPTPTLPQRGRESSASSAPMPQIRESSPAFQAEPRAEGIEQMDWATLHATVANCRACGLCQRRTHAVFGVGPQPADWLVVGEAPGHEEDLAAEPFVGASGQLLDNMLRAIGLSRGAPAPTVYIANVIKCRPPQNRNPEPHEVAQCAPYLRRQIELLQPKIILALGRFAADALLHGLLPDAPRTPLGKLRGKVYRYQNGSNAVPLVVSYHPAYLLRNLAAKAQAWEDLCLALDALRLASESGRQAAS